MIPHALGFLGGLGIGELLVILLVIILFFGAAKIPELARSLGKAKGEFERGAREGREEAAKGAADEATRIKRAAKELGIPVEGRTLDEIKADLRART